MKRFASVFLLVLLTVMLIGCTPVLTSILPTFTPMLSSSPTITYTPIPTSTLTLTPTPPPLPSSTASFGSKRVSIKEFIPNLSFDVPISLEIPKDFVLCQFPDSFDTYFWASQNCEGYFRPQNTSYFQAKLAPNVTYESQIDRFINVPNDFNDKDIMSFLESIGVKLNRIERKNIGEFPVLILELGLPYEDESEVVKTQLVNRVYIATLVDTNVLWIDYYFYLPTDFEKESSIWDHFESSFERNP